jgi:hypothetical protein
MSERPGVSDAQVQFSSQPTLVERQVLEFHRVWQSFLVDIGRVMLAVADRGFGRMTRYGINMIGLPPTPQFLISGCDSAYQVLTTGHARLKHFCHSNNGFMILDDYYSRLSPAVVDISKLIPKSSSVLFRTVGVQVGVDTAIKLLPVRVSAREMARRARQRNYQPYLSQVNSDSELESGEEYADDYWLADNRAALWD